MGFDISQLNHLRQARLDLWQAYVSNSVSWTKAERKAVFDALDLRFVSFGQVAFTIDALQHVFDERSRTVTTRGAGWASI